MDKTELLWVGNKYNLFKLNGSGSSLQLKSSTDNLSQHVRVLGVQFSSDLCLDKHIFCVAVPASTSFANYDASGVRLTRSLRQHSCTPSDIGYGNGYSQNSTPRYAKTRNRSTPKLADVIWPCLWGDYSFFVFGFFNKATAHTLERIFIIILTIIIIIIIRNLYPAIMPLSGYRGAQYAKYVTRRRSP